MSPGVQNACVNCSIEIDSRVTTSSVKLIREYGNVSELELLEYVHGFTNAENGKIRFEDFFAKFQAGEYSVITGFDPQAGQTYASNIKLSDEEAAKVTDPKSFNKVVSGDRLNTRLGGPTTQRLSARKITPEGGFSSITKAKFRLSIPIRARIATSVQLQTPVTKTSVNFTGQWIPLTFPAGPPVVTPVTKDISISMFTMFHPSPIRIENVQHDAILSLNDPSDESVRTVILIPLKSSNINDDSVRFFNKIAKHLTSISQPDSVTNRYPETDIPVGNDWGIKDLFWLSNPNKETNLSTVTDAYFSWTGAQSYKRVEVSRSSTEIRYGWKPSGRIVNYFMLQTPVAISPVDLSFLTRSLPPTPPEKAIHRIPDPTSGNNPKILYKQATPPASEAGCGIVRERMTNPGPGDMVSSLLSGGSVSDLLVDDKGNKIDMCDPFAMNAKNTRSNAGAFTPTRMLATFFNVMVLVAIAFGAWIAFYFVANKDYDYTYRDFSKDAGKVVGILAARAGAKTPAAEATASSSPLPGLPDLSKLTASPSSAISDLSGKELPPQLSKLSSLSKLSGLLGKKG